MTWTRVKMPYLKSMKAPKIKGAAIPGESSMSQAFLDLCAKLCKSKQQV